MEMNRLTREADELIRKVVARYNSLYTPAGSVSQVEIDLLLDELRLMYEKFKLISQLNLQHQYQELKKTSLQTAGTDTPAISRQSSDFSQQISAPAPGQTTEIETYPESTEVEQEKTQEVAPRTDLQNTTVIPEEEKAPEPQPGGTPQRETAIPSNPGESATLADKFRNEQRSLSDVISSKQDESIGSKLGHSHITDLKSVIGLAEKFAFVNELFGGDPLAYEKAIIQLNSASRLTEAEAYLGTLRLNHKWTVDSPQAALLTEIIRRKFNA